MTKIIGSTHFLLRYQERVIRNDAADLELASKKAADYAFHSGPRLHKQDLRKIKRPFYQNTICCLGENHRLFFFVINKCKRKKVKSVVVLESWQIEKLKKILERRKMKNNTSS